MRAQTRNITVPLSDKRHRRSSHEIPKVIQGLILRLEKLNKERSDEEEAIITFRTLYRLIFTEKGGRPKYPEFSQRDAEALIEMYEDDRYTLRQTSSFSEKELVRARITS